MKTYKFLSLRGRDCGRARGNLTFFVLLFVAASIVPVFASAATSAGVTPGSFWYFFDTASEKIALFFTFNPENKAKKALEYADERLAEIDAIAGDKNPDAVKAAIADYEGNVALATEKSKEVKDKTQAESLLNSIESSASKNQETLSAVLIKVPEEARAAITQAIEASKKGQEEAAKQISELKGEVEKLRQEVAELKQAKDVDQSFEVEKLKKEVGVLKQSQTQQQKSASSPPHLPAKTTSIVTFPSGAVVEMGANGNVIRTIKEAPQANIAPQNSILCNGRYWTPCVAGQRFYCPAIGDAQCLTDNISNQNNISQLNPVNPATSQVEKLLQQEIVKQNSWYEEYLRKQAEVEERLKPVNEEWKRIYARIQSECPIAFYTGQKARDCDLLTLKLNELNSEASRISGIYPERTTLPKVPTPQFQQWRIDTMPGGMGGTIWSPNSTTRYRWSCTNVYSCVLTNY